MKTRASLCLLITGLFASATLQGCYFTSTAVVSRHHKEVVEIHAVPPNANIWKDDPNNILGPSPQQVEFEYDKVKKTLSWGYYIHLIASAALSLGGLAYFTNSCDSSEGIDCFSALAGIPIGAASLLAHGVYGAIWATSPIRNYDQNFNSPAWNPIGASYRDSEKTTVSGRSSISFAGKELDASSETVSGFPNLPSRFWVPSKSLGLGLQKITLDLTKGQAMVTKSTQTKPPKQSTDSKSADAPTPTLPTSPPEQSIQSSKAGALGASMKAGPKPVVAVFDIQDTRKKRGLSVQEKADLTAYLITLLTNTSRYASVPKADLKAALSAQKAQSYDACYDESCQIEIGKEVAAEKSLSTRISKFGQKCIVAMTMYDLRKSATENAVQDRVRCDPDSLIAAFEKLVPQLAASQAPAVPQSNGTMF